MTIRRIPVRNAMANEQELLEGHVGDVLPNDAAVYVDRGGKTYDSAKHVKMGDLPQTGVIQLPRTTWYAIDPQPLTEDLAVVGYVIGPHGCVPIYEGRTHANSTHRRPRSHDLGRTPTPRGRGNWRTRKAARAAFALELPDRERGSSHSAE